MGSFFKIFFASLLALIIFTIIGVFFLVSMVGGLASKKTPVIEAKSVLVLNLAQHYKEQAQEDILTSVSGDDERSIPGLYDVVRLLKKAETDQGISGIYIEANGNANGFAASEEIRSALQSFKKSGKFIIAHGDMITQKSYMVADVADKLYANPVGGVDWGGFNVTYTFLKGTLDKLEIQPQIFYAGKFKSATEPLRTDKMTPENRLQTSVWLGDLYSIFLMQAAEVRKIDTAQLHQLADEQKIQNSKDAFENKLVDGLKYDDEVKDEIKNKLGLGRHDKINFVSINKYAAAGGFKKFTGDRIAMIYAEGDIVDGNGDDGSIGSEDYIKMVRKARLDQGIKAIVFRINSGGGSSLASENIWRELFLAKKEKPVVVSFGDVAASGGYYVSCAADSIFAQPTTITGSIGVFGIIPDMHSFFKNKLGVTFDGVNTADHSDAGTPYRPLDDKEKKLVQSGIENTYAQFKQRVADGRKKDTAYIETIAQGRVWTGLRAKEIGLIDRFGGIQDAVDCAARLAKLADYRVKEYPEPKSFFDRILGTTKYYDKTSVMMKKEMGEENYAVYEEVKKIRQMTNGAQMRLPFRFFIQ
jgi:protease IV